MSVGTYSLLSSADDFFAYVGGATYEDALWLYFTGTSGTNTVQVNDDSLVLVDEDNGTTTIDITSSSYDTLTELVAGINAVAGWDAGLVGHSSETSSNLRITGALNAEGKANTIYLEIKQTYLVEKLIDRATDIIERYCNRLFKTRTYTNETYWGTGYKKLILDQYPVTRVARIGEGRTNSFSIKNTSTDANYSTVEITTSTIRLIVDGGTNADDTELTLSDYTSIDDLITAIEALGKGWSCTTIATDTSYRDADELLPRPSMYVDSTKQAYCETPDELITDYKWLRPTSQDRNEGMLHRDGGWSEGTEYFVTYTAGFTTIPEALQMACLELVNYKHNNRQSGNLKSEWLGDYRYERFGISDLKLGLPADIKSELDMFKKRVI